ncbi:hypothetical protein MRX96_039751 [Rhipicephalus microplus]
MSCCNWSYRLYRRRLDSRYGNCYCLNCHGQEQHNASIFNYHTVSAPNAGLTLTLDVQPQEYLPTSTAMGFLVMVHGRGFRADACADSVFAQPGYITYIGLIQRRRAALPEPYQPPCRDTWPSRLKYYLQNTTRYTREAHARTIQEMKNSWKCAANIYDCLKICHQEMIRSRCKCESQNLPYSSREDRLKTPVCGGWFLAQVVVYFKTLTFESVASVPKYDHARRHPPGDVVMLQVML